MKSMKKSFKKIRKPQKIDKKEKLNRTNEVQIFSNESYVNDNVDYEVTDETEDDVFYDVTLLRHGFRSM